MKIKGQKLEEPNKVLFVLPRNGIDLVFYFKAILDYKDFDELCKRPEPPKIMKKGSITRNTEDPEFNVALGEYVQRRMSWAFLKSIAETPELEWETVKIDDPNTWTKWEDELTASGFTPAENNLLFGKFREANNINEDTLTEARERFLALQSHQEKAL